MVQEWIVKSGVKSVQLRKQPQPDSSEQNVLGMLKAGESVHGEFLFIRRASREAGFLRVQHLEPQGGSKWLVSASAGSALLRKHPTEAEAQGNSVGYAMDGELVDAEYLFCTRLGEKKGGYVKVKHLKRAKERKMRVEPTLDSGEFARLAEALRSKASGQRWAVLDSGHDGAWLRRRPSSDRTSNIVCLVPNGAVVSGDWLHLRRGPFDAASERLPFGLLALPRIFGKPQLGLAGPDEGFLLFQRLEQQGPKTWRLKCDDVLRETAEAPARDANPQGVSLAADEVLEGEYVLVSYKDGKHQGFIKRHYLIATATENEPEANAPKRQ
eukprot:s528_g33.t1